jgi:hypothetical protein
MMAPLEVRRSTMAAQRQGSVTVTEGFVGGDGDTVLLFTFDEDLNEEFDTVAAARGDAASARLLSARRSCSTTNPHAQP